jgi:chemotaxis protein MotB
MIIFLVSSCVSSKKYNDLLAENEAMGKTLEEKNAMIEGLEGEKTALMAQADEMNTKISGLESDVSDLKSKSSEMSKQIETLEGTVELSKKQYDELVAKVRAAFAYEGLTVTEKNNKLYVNTGKVSFRSGSANLNKEGRESVDALTGVLTNNPSIGIMIEGHTDSRLVMQGGAFADNYDLSLARARAAFNRLRSKGAENPMSMVGLAYTEPIVSEAL